MIDHVGIKVKDVEKSKEFYEKALASLDHKIAFGKETVFHAFDIGNKCLFEIMQNEDGEVLTTTHIAFRGKNKEQVETFYKSALEAGATDNGKPGPRPDYTENYYACFVLDPDGHNIEVMFDEV